MSKRVVMVHPNAAQLAEVTAVRWLLKLFDLQQVRRPIHTVISGGTMGIALLDEAARSPLAGIVDWSGVHFWFADERYLKSGKADRNETQAREALLDRLIDAGLLPEDNIHAIPGPDKSKSVEAAADDYAATLAEFAAPGETVPAFDVVLLGMGPDGHTASLFPGDRAALNSIAAVVGVHDSPKPPPERVSLSLDAINAGRQVWVVVAGTEKAEKTAEALADGAVDDVPAAGVAGTDLTLWLLDTAAADAP